MSKLSVYEVKHENELRLAVPSCHEPNNNW